jgi:hypothetical protein
MITQSQSQYYGEYEEEYLCWVDRIRFVPISSDFIIHRLLVNLPAVWFDWA